MVSASGSISHLLSFPSPSPSKNIYCCLVKVVNLRSATTMTIHNQLPQGTNCAQLLPPQVHLTVSLFCCRYWAITDPFTYPSRMSDTREAEEECSDAACLCCRIFLPFALTVMRQHFQVGLHSELWGSIFTPARYLKGKSNLRLLMRIGISALQHARIRIVGFH